MNIIPRPQKLDLSEGSFKIGRKLEIAIDEKCCSEVVTYAFWFKKAIYEQISVNIGIRRIRSDSAVDRKFIVSVEKELNEEEYIIEIDEKQILLKAGSKQGFLYGFKTLEQIFSEYRTKIPCLKITDYSSFRFRGFYHDVTRGKVPSLKTLKYIADKAVMYKINQLQLYIEHTFAFENISEMWRGSDCLSPEDILEFDKYCAERNIELVPSFATFGHLYSLLSTKSFSKLCECDDCAGKRYSWFDRQIHYTIDPTNPDGISLIKNMINQVAPLFSSDKFNICCDETFDLGTDKSKKRADEIGIGRLYLEYVSQIFDCVRDNNKTPMCWSDIIIKHGELIPQLPKDVIYLTWGYDGPVEENRIKPVSDSGLKYYVCPGVSGWNRLMNDIDSSYINISTTAQYGYSHGALGVLNTDWGDFGHVNSLFSSIPGLIIGASYSWNVNNTPELSDISKLEYGVCSVVGMLAELSKAECFNWSDLVSFREQQDGYDNEIMKPWVTKEFADARTYEILAEAYSTAMSIKDSFESLSHEGDCHLSYLTFAMLAEGIALFNALFVVIKNREFGGCGDVLIAPSELAQKIEYWFFEYEKDWRKMYRESELNRIRECVFLACDYLRDSV